MVSKNWDIVDAIGGSMTPFILPGSKLHVERQTTESISKGDVVCYIGEYAQGMAHRVMRKTVSDLGVMLFTKGDAQNAEEAVPAESVVFVVKRVEHRIFSYDTGSLVGRLVASIALGEDAKTRSLRWLFRRFFRVLVFSKRRIQSRSAK